MGVGKCNNPFFENCDPAYAPVLHHLVVDGDFVKSQGRTAFSNHAFALRTNDVFDACAGPVCGTDLGQYKGSVIDTSTPREASAASGGCVYRSGGMSLVVGVTDVESGYRYES